MTTIEHERHLTERTSHSNCPECRADTSRRSAVKTPFRYRFVHDYLAWARPRLDAIRNGVNSVDASTWQRNFVSALHNRISSHIPNQTGRKFAPEYAKYHLAAYGNDFRFLHNL
jgi:hypothetical protein